MELEENKRATQEHKGKIIKAIYDTDVNVLILFEDGSKLVISGGSDYALVIHNYEDI